MRLERELQGRVMVVGVGNTLLGDDGAGPELHLLVVQEAPVLGDRDREGGDAEAAEDDGVDRALPIVCLPTMRVILCQSRINLPTTRMTPMWKPLWLRTTGLT